MAILSSNDCREFRVARTPELESRGYPCLFSVALDGHTIDLWQAKDARNGIVGLTVDGVEPFRISTDPMRSAWPKLRAAGIPAGMGVS